VNLTSVLADETCEPTIRQAAGVTAKNQLIAKDAARNREMQYNYTRIQDEMKEQTKNNVN
jgi:hypothetical protein